MNSVQEIKSYLATLDAGKARFKVAESYSNLEMEIDEWATKRDLVSTGKTPLEFFIANALERHFDKENKKMIIYTDNVTNGLSTFIYDTVLEMAEETSHVAQPKRTNAYKDIVLVTRLNCREELFINDMLPVINYYYKAKTDTKNNEMDMVVHKNNVQALFNALRKKYGSKKNM
jgi:hypothetical protein